MDWASRLEGGSSGSANYSYDPIGRLTGQSDAFPSFSGSNVSWTFGISPASQIASETRDNDGYAFTGISTANKGYTVNGLNQYTAVAGTGHTYDASGNLTGDGTNVYIYDGENRLVSATAAGQTATLTYDPLGRLFQVVKGAANTRFLYDGDALVAEYDGSGALTNRYVHGSNLAADDPLLWYVGSGTGTKRYLHADHLGSIVAGTNAGAAPTINAYDEYGVPAASNVGRFQYTGQIWLSELGLYHYKARLYSPSLGRFLQVDPVGYDDQTNLYAYVADDPINNVDADGQQFQVAIPIARGCAANSFCRNLIISGGRAILRAIVSTLSSSRRDPGPFLYRGLRKTDLQSLAAHGAILPKNPGARATPDMHVVEQGRAETQFVSLSRDPAVAAFYAHGGPNSTGMVITVDQSKLPSIIDVGRGEQLHSPDAKKLARGDQEVLTSFIPANAIINVKRVPRPKRHPRDGPVNGCPANSPQPLTCGSDADFIP